MDDEQDAAAAESAACADGSSGSRPTTSLRSVSGPDLPHGGKSKAGECWVAPVIELADRRVEHGGTRAEREEALELAERWSARVGVAREGYAKTLELCRALGIPNTIVARRVGKSEAAIRMHHLRKDEQ